MWRYMKDDVSQSLTILYLNFQPSLEITNLHTEKNNLDISVDKYKETVSKVILNFGTALESLHLLFSSKRFSVNLKLVFVSYLCIQHNFVHIYIYICKSFDET